MKKITELIGKPTINPLFFYSGKISGYFTWIILLFSQVGIDLVPKISYKSDDIITYSFTGFGLLVIIISLINLGRSTRFGLPIGYTEFTTMGIYKISRNPMYLGINLLTISAMIHTLNTLVIILGVYSIVIYHLIILEEERYLGTRFGADYMMYKKKVRRYL
jgi:protein-S-isoprenylcysteine O-methyltransferase Ste14